MSDPAGNSQPPQHAEPPRRVPLVRLGANEPALHEEVLAAIARVGRRGDFVLGREVEAFEASLAGYCGCRHAVGCASGSDALLLALLAHGIGPGHDVLVPAYTFFATVSAVVRAGARPVLVDIDPHTYHIDAEAARQAITPRTRAMIVVHLFGQCADMPRLNRLAAEHGLTVVEDAAQALGATRDGRAAGNWGHCGCFSFYPTKNLGAWGDAGGLVTNDSALAARLRSLRNHGMQAHYRHDEVGINSRLDTVQAAVLRVKLAWLDRWTRERQANANRYAELMAAVGLDRTIGLPRIDRGCRHVFHQYVIRVPATSRDALRRYLARCGVDTAVYYPVPLDQQPCLADKVRCGPLAEAARAARESLALPIAPPLSPDDQRYVVASIAAFFAGSRRVGPPRPKWLARREAPADRSGNAGSPRTGSDADSSAAEA